MYAIRSYYVVFFLTQKTPVRRTGRMIFLLAFLVHTVNITIERPGVRDPLEINIERDEIPLITVRNNFV